LRRVSGDTGAYLIVADIGHNGEHRDYAAASGVTYEYVARGYTAD
jgi:hypothetical protein